MSNYSLSIAPTKENIKDSIYNDILGNNKWISDFLTLFLSTDDSIIALNGKWGSGKTFLAKKMQEIINYKFNSQLGIENDIFINNAFKNLNSDSCFAIYYNAWEYDNENNPIVSFLYYLLKTLGHKIHSDKFKQIIENFISNVVEKISCGWVKIKSDGKKSNLEEVLSSVITSDYIYEEISGLLQELRSERCNKLVIIIDELDRCRPNYALKVIEMLNHYFKRDGILVLCMIDFEQLSNMIKTSYGTKTNAIMYLDKIFDMRFNIPEIDSIESYINFKVGTDYDDRYFFDTICTEIIKEKNLTLRNIDRFLSYIKLLFSEFKKHSDFDFPVKGLIMYFFTPYLISSLLFDLDEFDRIMQFDFTNIVSFCNRYRVNERINQIYNNSQNKDKAKNSVIENLKADLTTIIMHMKDKNNDATSLIVGKSYQAIHYLDRLDLLTLVIERVSCESDGNKKL